MIDLRRVKFNKHIINALFLGVSPILGRLLSTDIG